MYVETILNKLKEENLISDYKIRLDLLNYCDIEMMVIFNRKTYGFILTGIEDKEVSYNMLKEIVVQELHKLLDNF